MNSNLEKLFAAARAHRRPDDTPPPSQGLGGRLLAQARESTPDQSSQEYWLRGLAYGFAACALVAALMAAIQPPHAAAFEFQILAGIDADEINLLQP